MPTDIQTILLLPHDPAMLADGPGGSRPPTMLLCDYDERVHRNTGHYHVAGVPCREHPRTRALLLAHDGKVVEQARGWLPVDSQLLNDVLWVLHKPRNPETVWRTPEQALDILLANTQQGTIILLDANGREVTP